MTRFKHLLSVNDIFFLCVHNCVEYRLVTKYRHLSRRLRCRATVMQVKKRRCGGRRSSFASSFPTENASRETRSNLAGAFLLSSSQGARVLFRAEM